MDEDGLPLGSVKANSFYEDEPLHPLPPTDFEYLKTEGSNHFYINRNNGLIVRYLETESGHNYYTDAAYIYDDTGRPIQEISDITI